MSKKYLINKYYKQYFIIVINFRSLFLSILLDFLKNRDYKTKFYNYILV